MRAGEKGVVQSVVLFLGVSVLSGALAAGLAIPFAGLAGFGTERASESFEQLPQEMAVLPLPVRSRIVDSKGNVIANLFEQNRVYVPLRNVSPIVKKAVIAIEDSRFYEHGALDAKGTLRALMRNKSEGSVTQGGSSITQQFVKMTLIQQAKTEKEALAAKEETYKRKIKELRYAVAIEEQFSKDEILEKYLNVAYFGDGAYGVEAAARHYFKATAKTLTLEQAAMLAGLVKNPTMYDPTNNQRAAKIRRDVVLRRMQELQIITPQQADKAIKTPVKLNIAEVPNGCASAPRYAFFCDYVVSKLLANPELGRTPKDRERFIKREGITVQTTLDPNTQKAAEQTIYKRSNPTDQVVAALTMVEPGSGKVKAMAQSRPYGNNRRIGQTTYNFNVERSYPGGYGGFQNGSTMKAFTLAAAIQKGVPLSYVINSPDRIDLRGKKFTTCKGTVWDPTYQPKNSTKGGNIDLVTATKNSVNTYFLQLSQKIGLCPINQLAAKLGVVNGKTFGRQKLGQPLEEIPSYTLGVGSVTPVMMANAFATFAARGVYCDPVVITSIKDKAFKEIKTPKADCFQAMKPEHADGVNRALQEVINSGTGQALDIGRPAAGKTGTIDDNMSVWFVGYTPQLAGAAVVSDADPPYHDMIGLRYNGKKLGDATGGKLAGPLWEDTMRAALKGMPEEGFVKPSQKIELGDLIRLPSLTGMSPEDAANILRDAGFRPEIASERVPSDEAPEGTVAYTEPGRRSGAPAGSTVMIYVSNGQPKTKPTKPPITIKPPVKPGCPIWRPNCRR